MLANYYEVAQEDQFDTLFGRLDIGPSPTPLRNHYLILQWDFFCIDSSGSAQKIKKAHGLTPAGEIELGVPNLVMRKLYVERLQTLLLPDFWDRDEGELAAKKLYQNGDMADLCEFVETKYC
jgi:hypothetical protein